MTPKAALLRRRNFSLINLLDVKMPGLGRLGFGRCFQVNPKLKAVPIVF